MRGDVYSFTTVYRNSHYVRMDIWGKVWENIFVEAGRWCGLIQYCTVCLEDTYLWKGVYTLSLNWKIREEG